MFRAFQVFRRALCAAHCHNFKAHMEGIMEGPEGIIHIRGLVVFMPCNDRVIFYVSLNAE